MHGIILFELGRFAGERIGAQAWQDVLRSMNLSTQTFTPIRPEPDERVMQVMTALASAAEMPLQELLRAFGRWLAPHLMATYAPLIQPGWNVLDILDHIEVVIHSAVRLRDPQATPPLLETVRNDDGSRTVVYASQRRLCALATGLVEGIALSQGHVASVTQPQCMLAGHARCELLVRLS